MGMNIDPLKRADAVKKMTRGKRKCQKPPVAFLRQEQQLDIVVQQLPATEQHL